MGGLAGCRGGGGHLKLVVLVSEKPNSVSEKSGKSQGILFIYGAGNPVEHVFRRNVMQRFAKENKDDKLILERQWEIKKRTIMESVKRVIIQLPLSLTNETTKPEFQQNIQKSGYTNMVSTRGDKLIIQNEICIQMFDEARHNLLPHIDKELAKVGKLKTIIMIGGFS